MVRSKQPRQPVGQRETSPVGKLELRARRENLGAPNSPKISVEGNLPKRQHGANAAEKRELAEKIRLAVRELLGARPVLGRGAAQGGRDVAVLKAEPIVARARNRLARLAMLIAALGGPTMANGKAGR